MDKEYNSDLLPETLKKEYNPNLLPETLKTWEEKQDE